MICFQSLFESSNSKDGLVWKKSFWTRLWLSFTYLAFCLSLWNLFSSIFARANSITISLDAGTLHSACRSFRAQSAHANALVFEKTLYGFQITVYGYWSIYGIFLLLYGIKNNYAWNNWVMSAKKWCWDLMWGSKSLIYTKNKRGPK